MSNEAVTPFYGMASKSSCEDRLDVINPANGQRCCSIPVGSEEDVNRAVASARAAFDDGRWSEAPPSFRKTVLHRFSELVLAEAGVLDQLDAGEMGKPVSVQFANSTAAAGLMRFYAEAVDKVAGDVFSSDHKSFVAQRRVPRGVVAAVVPWNFPTYNAILKVAPALAAGNCVVLKPSELSSRSAVRLANLAISAGLPPGVFNVVPGLGQTVGRALAMHQHVDMIAFTGSTAVGKLMAKYAADSNMKVVQTECGGKSPQIVFDDGVALNEAGEAIARFLLTNQGQICSVGSRLLVQRSIEKPLLEIIGNWMQRIVIGDPIDPKTTFGPLASSTQCERVMRYIAEARRTDAQLVLGGNRMHEDTGGYFVEPTVFRSVDPAIPLAQEEIFGPVLAVTAFDTEAEAVRIANGTKYGLGAYVWTANMSTGMRMMKSLRSSVRINATLPVGEGSGYAASHEPEGQSGWGTEGGLAGMETYLRRQRVWFSHA
jgi:acyl-CoA reductase-like NAD-dependent aldehyde dehydrogenase